MRIRVASSGDTENIHVAEDDPFPSKEQGAEVELTHEERRRDLHKQLFHLRHMKQDNVQDIDQQSAMHCAMQLSEEEQTIGTDNEVRHYLQGNNSQPEGMSAGIGHNGTLPATDTVSSTIGGPLLEISLGETVSDSGDGAEELLFIENVNAGSAIEPCTTKNHITYEQQEELVADADNNANPPGGTEKENAIGLFTGSMQEGKTNWFKEAPAEMVLEKDIPQITEQGLHSAVATNICSNEDWTETVKIEKDPIQNDSATSVHGREEQSQLDVPVPGATEVELVCVSQENYSNIHAEATGKYEEDSSLLEKLSTDSKDSHSFAKTISLQEDYLLDTWEDDGEGSNGHDTVSASGQNGKQSSDGTAYRVHGFANYAAESQEDLEPTETRYFLRELDTEDSCSLINTAPISPRDSYDLITTANDTPHLDSLLNEIEDEYFTHEEDERSVLEHALKLADMKHECVLETGSFAEKDVHRDDENTTGTSTSNHTDSRAKDLSTQKSSLETGHYHTGDNSEQSDYVTWQGLKSALGDNPADALLESQLSETESNANEIQSKKEESTVLGMVGESPGGVYNPLLFLEESISLDKHIPMQAGTNRVIEKSNEYAIEIMSAAVQEITQEKWNVLLHSELPTEKEDISETQEAYVVQVPDSQSEESSRSNMKDQSVFGSSRASVDEQLQKHNINASQVPLEPMALHMSHIVPKQELECPATAGSDNTVLWMWQESVPSVYAPSSNKLPVSEETISCDDHALTQASIFPCTEKSYDYAVETVPEREEEIALGQLNVTLPNALQTKTQESVSDEQENHPTRVPDSQSEESSKNDMRDQPEFDNSTAFTDKQLQKDSSQVHLETAALQINHIYPKQETECPAIGNEEVFDHSVFTQECTNKEPAWESPTKVNDSNGTKTSPHEIEHLAYVCQESFLAPSARDNDLPCSVWHDNVSPSATAPSSKTSVAMFDHDDIQSSSSAPSSASCAGMGDVPISSQIATIGDSFPFSLITPGDTFSISGRSKSLSPTCDTSQIGVEASFNERETKREIPSGPVILISEAAEERYEIIYAEETMASEPTLTSLTEEQPDSCQPFKSEAFSTEEMEECALPSDSVILKRVSYTVFYFLIFVILAVIIYQCDLTVCCILYLFSLYWLCWDRGTNKESLKKD